MNIVIIRNSSKGTEYVSDILVNGNREKVIWTMDGNDAMTFSEKEAEKIAKKYDARAVRFV